MTMTHPPAAAPAGQPPQPGDPGQPDRSADRAVRIQITPGGYLLGVLAAAFSALTLPDAAPGRTALAYLAAAAVLVAALLGSLIAHELGHALVARRYGGSGAVTVGFLGGRRHGRDELATPRAHWRVAAAGPAASLLLTGAGVAATAVMAALGVFAHRSGALPFVVIAIVTWINGLLALANLIPGAGLDGGRIVRALAWARSGDPARASLIAARVGQVTGAVLTAAGVTTVLTGHLPGLWIVLLGLVMIGASRSEAGQALTAAALDGLTVRDLLPPPGTGVPAARGWQTVQDFLDEAGVQPGSPLPGRAATTAYPVRDFDGRPAGLVTLSQLRAVPAARRPVTRLSQAATGAEHLVFTTPDEPLAQLRSRLSVRPASPAALHTAGHALVLGPGGELAGVITPADFARAAQFGPLRSPAAGRPAGGAGAEGGTASAGPQPG